MSCGPGIVWELRTTVPATLQAAEQMATGLRCHLPEELPASHRFAAELLFREALTNAVVHGCQRNPERHIRCFFRLRTASLTIAIAHDGAGFDWRSAWNRVPDVSATSGRGLQVLRRFATRVRFNHEGNAVFIRRRCGERS